MNAVPCRNRATHPTGKVAILALALGLITSLMSATTAAADDEVTIPDANLHACVSAQLSEDALPADFTAANLAALTKLFCLREVADLRGIEALTGVGSVTLADVTTSDVTPLASLTGLTKLALVAPNLTDPSPLSHLTELGYLFLTAPQVTSYAFAAPLTNITSTQLRVSATADPHDLAPLTKLQSALLNIDAQTGSTLDELSAINSLNVTTTASDLAGLTLPPTVKSLVLNGKNVTSVADLPHSDSMGSLWLGTPPLTSLDGIDEAPNLTRLDAGGLSLTDASALQNEHQLATVRVRSNKLTSLPDLSALTNLRDLDISYNPITSLAPLHGLALTDLNAQLCPVESLDPLSGMRLNTLQLKYAALASLEGIANVVSPTAAVNLSYSGITDPKFLLDLPTGVSVNLAGNKISDVSALADLPSGMAVDLSSNRIRDLSPLPDDTSVNVAHQWAGSITVAADEPVDLGLRSITGARICPDATTGLTCEGGVATFAATRTGGLSWTAGDTFSGYVIATAPVPPPTPVPMPAPVLRISGDAGWPRALFFDIDFAGWSGNWPSSWKADWYRDGALIQSDTSVAPNSAHTATVADLGHDITVCVTTSGGRFPGQTACSKPLHLEPATFPSIHAKISGKPRVGRLLFAITGSAPYGTTETYTWLRNGHRIKGWTGMFYRPKRADRGKRISVRVTWRHPAYVTATSTSARVRIKR